MKFLKKFNENVRKGVLLYYAFDFDDNILNMPTEIMVQTKDGQEVGMSTSDFAIHRSKLGKENINFKGKNIVGLDYNTAFRNFRDIEDPEIFKKDVAKALQEKSYAPAWDDFIECLTNGSIFAIITARGHESEGMRKGVEYIIDNLEQEDKKKMHDSLLMFLQLFGKSRNNEQDYESASVFSKSELVKNYLNLCHFVGVSAPSRGGSPASPEAAKEDALRAFITDVNGYAQKIGFDAKVGFSDDDKGNVEHMTKALSSEDLDHEKLWPFVKEFIIKDTNKPYDILTTNISTRKVKTFSDFNESQSQITGLQSSTISMQPENNLMIMADKTDGFSANGDETRQDAYGNRLKAQTKRLVNQEWCPCCDNTKEECDCDDSCERINYENIFENFSDKELKNLKETCENYLAYLLDEDFSIRMDDGSRSRSIHPTYQQDYLDIDILVPKTGKYSEEDWYDNVTSLSWSDIKEHVIPLISLFKRGKFDYKLKSVNFFFHEYGEEEISGKELDYLIDDSSELNTDFLDNGISCISIRVKK